MKKTSKHTGVKEKESTDYFAMMRASEEPIESYGIEEFHKRIEAARKEKARKAKENEGNVS